MSFFSDGVKSENVRLSEVFDVDIVSNARAVRRVVIVAENLQPVALT